MYYLLGTKFHDYVSKKTNKQVRGYTIFLACENPSVTGYETLSFFVSEVVFIQYFGTLELYSRINLCFDRFGHVISCSNI